MRHQSGYIDTNFFSTQPSPLTPLKRKKKSRGMEREKGGKFVRKSKDESYLDEQVDWLADAEWFASSGLSASAAQTLYPRHSSSVFSPLRCLLFATPIPLPTLLSHDSLFLARSSSSFRKSLKAFRSYPRRSFVAASRGFPLPLVTTFQLFSKFTPFHADYSKTRRE